MALETLKIEKDIDQWFAIALGISEMVNRCGTNLFTETSNQDDADYLACLMQFKKELDNELYKEK